MVDFWIIQKEKQKQPDNRPVLQIPIYDEYLEEEEPKKEESNRGVIVINLFDDDEEV